jgi:hypothetical protein
LLLALNNGREIAPEFVVERHGRVPTPRLLENFQDRPTASFRRADDGYGPMILLNDDLYSAPDPVEHSVHVAR